MGVIKFDLVKSLYQERAMLKVIKNNIVTLIKFSLKGKSMETKDQIIQDYLNSLGITDEQKIFIREYSFKRTTFEGILTVLRENDNSKQYADVQRLNIECRYYVDIIQNVRKKFNSNKQRQKDNDSFEEFFKWYMDESKKLRCHYCDVTQEQLTKLFVEEKSLPLNGGTKRSSGVLEIERKDNKNNSYHISNLVLACPLCNNAKSNLIDEDSWKEFFKKPMQEYYQRLLTKTNTKVD